MKYTPKARKEKWIWLATRLPLIPLSLVGWILIRLGMLFYLVAKGIAIAGAVVVWSGKSLDRLAWKIDAKLP